MSKIVFWSKMLLVFLAFSLIIACNDKDDHEENEKILLDNIQYTIHQGQLVVTGYIKGSLKGQANIVSSIKYKGKTYDVKRIYPFAFAGCRDITSIVIPNSINSIGDSAFQGCTGLSSITLPNSVEQLGYTVFKGCSNLREIHCKTPTPPNIYYTTFYYIRNSSTNYPMSFTKLFVPKGCLQAYLYMKWNKFFKSIIEE